MANLVPGYGRTWEVFGRLGQDPGCSAHVMDSVFVFPQFMVEALTPNVTIFGGGTFGRLLGLDEVMIMEPPG